MKTTLIFLISVFTWSCQMINKEYQIPQMTLNIADDYDQLFRPITIKREDPKTCKFVMEKKPVVPYVNKPVHGGACLTPEDYQKWREWRRKQCEKEQKK